MYFRGGSPESCFEHGQQEVPEWRHKTELQVLIERVASGAKPYALFVVRGMCALEDVKRVANEIKDIATEHGLEARSYENQWGVWVVDFVRDPAATLQSLAAPSSVGRFHAVEPRYDAVLALTLGHFLRTGAPDIAKGDSPLACGLVYGYSLSSTWALYKCSDWIKSTRMAEKKGRSGVST